jgi:hypothetical protein
MHIGVMSIANDDLISIFSFHRKLLCRLSMMIFTFAAMLPVVDLLASVETSEPQQQNLKYHKQET